MRRVAIVYDSVTKNTASLAMAINEAIQEICEVVYFGTVDEVTELEDIDLYLVGSWTTKLSCSPKIQKYLGSLKNKDIAYFGTCAYRSEAEYFRKIIYNVREHINSSCMFHGGYLTLGRMPESFLPKYLEIATLHLGLSEEEAKAQYQKALLHPDKDDIDRVCLFALKLLSN